MKVVTFEEVRYKNKTIDRGYILGHRSHAYLLRRKRQPLWEKILSVSLFANQIL